jgi:hypothetical protein
MPMSTAKAMLKNVLTHPMSGCNLRAYMDIIRTYHRFDGPVLRLLIPLAVLSPLRAYQRLRFGPRIERTEVPKDPIFIIGHWRSGTTFLEELLSQDARFGFSRYFGNQFPGLSVLIQKEGTLVHRLFADLQMKRPQDNVVFTIDTPSEEEFAIAKVSKYSFLHAWIFRDRWDELARKYLTMETIEPAEFAEWQAHYHALVRRWTLINGGKQLILKSPYNTARIGRILDTFPEAKFVHITRDPLEAIVSTIDMLEKMSGFAFTAIPERELADRIIETYALVACRYDAQRSLIPDGHLAEARFEDLMTEPKTVVESIYEQLHLTMDNATRAGVQSIIAAHGDYQRNRYQFPSDIVRRASESVRIGERVYGYTSKESA